MKSPTIFNPTLPVGSGSSNTKLHFAFLDGIRGFAAIYVAFGHIVRSLESSQLKNILTPISSYGHWAVDVFIVLSGFCLAIPVARNAGKLSMNTVDFFRKRAWRILPTYYTACLLCVILNSTVIGALAHDGKNASMATSVADIWSHAFLVHDWWQSTSYTIDYPMWSIGVEWKIYFLFPLFIWWASKFTKWSLICLSFVAFLAYYAFLSHAFYQYCSIASPHYIALFAFGVVASLGSYGPKGDRFTSFWWVGVVAAIFVKFAFHALYRRLGIGQFADTAIDIEVGLIAASVMAYASNANWVGRCLGWKPIAWVGTFGYSLYLIHAPLISILHLGLRALNVSPTMEAMLSIIVGAPIIVGAAYVFYIAFERPFLTKRSWSAWVPSTSNATK